MIAAEQQGHGHTADVDRPITYEQMADDTAALLGTSGSSSADVIGYSMGGAPRSSWRSATRRGPQAGRRLRGLPSDGMHAVAWRCSPRSRPRCSPGSPIEEAYLRTVPNPGDFPTLVEKLTRSTPRLVLLAGR